MSRLNTNSFASDREVIFIRTNGVHLAITNRIMIENLIVSLKYSAVHLIQALLIQTDDDVSC